MKNSDSIGEVLGMVFLLLLWAGGVVYLFVWNWRVALALALIKIGYCAVD